jgi:putative phosphoribosyl transferase
MMFYDRKEAGELLGAALVKYQHLDPLIVAIPRGGVPVAYEVAKILKAPLDVAITKKIGHPFNSEYAIGALGMNAYILNPGAQGIPEDYLHDEICRVKKMVQEKSNIYHQEFPVQEISGRWIILVDDGIATGSTILLTADILKKQSPAGIIIAVPVAPDQSIKKLEDNSSVNEVVCLHASPNFRGVGQFYENFAPVEDSEAMDLLRKAIPAEQ